MIVCIFKCPGCELRIRVPFYEVLENKDQGNTAWCSMCEDWRIFIFERVCQERDTEIVIWPPLLNDVPD